MLILVNMQSFIIIGNLKDRQDFINNYIVQNKIPSYNIYTYDEKLKISDARDIKKKLGIKGYGETCRIFVINEGGTIEAQNALLKSIEELPSDVVFFFSTQSKDTFLPTIISRSSLKHFKQEKLMEDAQVDEEVNKAFSNSGINSCLKLTDSLFANKDEDDNYGKLVLSIRNVLLSSLGQDKDKGKILADVLLKLNKNYGLVKTNNLNKRFLTEKIFLESF